MVCYTLNNGYEIIDNTENAHERLQAMKKAEKRKAIEKAKRRRKAKVENIKLTIGIFVMTFLMFGGMCFHWLYFGY